MVVIRLASSVSLAEKFPEVFCMNYRLMDFIIRFIYLICGRGARRPPAVK